MTKQTISKDLPFSELTLRKYEKPYNIDERELIRKLCLSLGLLQPGDSRDIIVDVLYVLLNAKKKQELLSSEKIRENVINFRKENRLSLKGAASSNIRRQIKRLRDLFLVEKIKNNYRITENEKLSIIFKEKISTFVLNEIMLRIDEYLKKVDEKF